MFRTSGDMSEWVLSENAAEDLIEIYVYTFREFGPRQAETYAGGIEERFSNLAGSPSTGRALIGIAGDYRQSVYGRHVIVYRAQEKGIFIVRVLHGRRDITRILQSDIDE